MKRRGCAQYRAHVLPVWDPKFTYTQQGKKKTGRIQRIEM